MLSRTKSTVAPPVDIMAEDINLDSGPDNAYSYIDLTYSQFKKYQTLIKDRDKLKEEVYKDQAKFNVQRMLFGDDELRKNMAKDRHEGIEFLERRFGVGYSDANRIKPPSATYTFLVREKSPATLRREKMRIREWNKQQAVARKNEKLAALKSARRQDSEIRYFSSSEEAGHATDCLDDLDDINDDSRDFLSRITPKTRAEERYTSPVRGRRKKQQRMVRPRYLPPLENHNVRRLTIRIPSILENHPMMESKPVETSTTDKPAIPNVLPELTNVSSVVFQYPNQNKHRVVMIDDQWMAVREKKGRASPYGDDDEGGGGGAGHHHGGAVDKWRLFSTEDLHDAPSIKIRVHYPPDGKVQIKRPKRKKK